MTLLVLLACLPATFTLQADVFDMEGECWDTNVQVTLKMKYWREEYAPDTWGYTPSDGQECGWEEDVFPTADGRCVILEVGCTDRPPTVHDDPAFSFDHDDIVICSSALRGDYPWKACPVPALTEWP